MRFPFLCILSGLALALVPSASGQTSRRAHGPSQGRQLWLRADRGVAPGLSNLVSCWKDQSGNGRDLIAFDGSLSPRLDPLGLGGRPALHFDGYDVLRRADGMPTGDYTKVAVVALDQYGMNNNVLSGDALHALFYGGTDRALMYHGGTFVTSSAATPLGQPTVLIATYDAAGQQGTLFQDGVQVGTGSASPNTDPSLEVGAFAFGNFLEGTVAEIMVYDRVLTGAEIAELSQGLALQYQRPGTPSVSLIRAPRDAEVLQRDDNDRAVAEFEGLVSTPGFQSVELEVRANGVLVETLSQPLVYLGGTASFILSPSIAAGLIRHDFQAFLVAGARRTKVAVRENVVCGDTYLVNGQSNAVATDYWAEGLGNQSQSPWIRSFGSGTTGTDVTGDLHWDVADGLTFNAHASVGSWALRMAEILVNEHGMPIGLLNGAEGGTAIALHQRNEANPTDLSTIYGRLLYRVQQAGMTSPRALFWYQGESDGEAAAAYQTSFADLYDDWKEDFPTLEKIYVFQIRLGCGLTFRGVREVLRTLPDVYPDIEVMSTTAAPQHDGCHFYYAGYRELGDRIARLVLRDLYGSTDTQEIDPPNIQSARWLGPTQDVLELTFRDPDDTLVWDPGSEQDFLLDDGTSVLSGSVAGNRVFLQLTGPSTATTVFYLGHPFDGPWLSNARGVGALTFFDFPISP